MEESEARSTILVRPTIMVVDDADENLMILEAILAGYYSLKLFNDAKAALEYAFANPPDLIMLDVMMPEIDGFECCRRLKANPKLADIPVIFITSKNEDEYEELGFSIGAADFIHKPINAPIVFARVKTHLKIKFIMDYLRSDIARLQESAGQVSSELGMLKELVWGGQFLKS